MTTTNDASEFTDLVRENERMRIELAACYNAISKWIEAGAASTQLILEFSTQIKQLQAEVKRLRREQDAKHQ